MKRKSALILSLVMAASFYGCGSTEANEPEVSNDTSVENSSDVAEESAETVEASYGLSELQGTYIELFPEFKKDENKDWWVECINTYETDSDAVESYYKMLTESYLGTVYGQEAVDTYTEETFLFDCFFENDIETITVDGNVISGTDKAGNEVFSHEYTYVEDIDGSYGDAVYDNYFHVFKTSDEDAGQFTYFVFTDDTPANEYHIEFRYGDNLDDLGKFIDGDYAYWMASGISQDYNEEMIHNCIKLFVDENVGGEE